MHPSSMVVLYRAAIVVHEVAHPSHQVISSQPHALGAVPFLFFNTSTSLIMAAAAQYSSRGFRFMRHLYRWRSDDRGRRGPFQPVANQILRMPVCYFGYEEGQCDPRKYTVSSPAFSRCNLTCLSCSVALTRSWPYASDKVQGW